MADLPTGRYPRLADPSDIPRLISGENVHWSWPPPGTTVIRSAFPEPWVIVYGEPTTGGADDWWVTDLATIAGLMDHTVEQLLLLLSRRALSNPVTAFAGGVANYPVIYSPGEGVVVKWIRNTIRGELGGGVEEFQFKVDWGNPGSDPSTTEAEALDLADDFASLWAAAFVASIGVLGSYAAVVASDVKFTEVGAVLWEQNTARDADGTGGDEAQSYPTAWHTYPTATRPTGTGGVALPYEVACAVTLQTDTRGPRGRGRLYLPPFGVNSMITGGVFSSATVSIAGEVIQKYFDDAKTATGLVPVVVSMRAKQLHEITSIQTGRVPDSQRRRRRSQAEAPTVQWVKP